MHSWQFANISRFTSQQRSREGSDVQRGRGASTRCADSQWESGCTGGQKGWQGLQEFHFPLGLCFTLKLFCFVLFVLERVLGHTCTDIHYFWVSFKEGEPEYRLRSRREKWGLTPTVGVAMLPDRLEAGVGLRSRHSHHKDNQASMPNSASTFPAAPWIKKEEITSLIKFLMKCHL